MSMSENWLTVKKELEAATLQLFDKCPDEILRFHYGIISHSEAGKRSYNQYFGHWVHAYAHYMMYAGDIMDTVRRLASHPDFELRHCKALWMDLSLPHGKHMLIVEYGGQKSLGKYIEKVAGCLDSLTTNQEFVDLIGAFQVYISRLYWWFHWYFPWGLGVSCQRVNPDDLQEMIRLSKPD